MRHTSILMAVLAAFVLSGCAATKIVTVPVKAVTKTVGTAADIVD